MDHKRQQQSIAQLERKNTRLTWANNGLTVGILVCVFSLAMRDQIVHLQTPGMPDGAEIMKSAMNKKAEFGTLSAVTANLVAINPSNAGYQKEFLKAYFAANVYTELSKEIDSTVRRLEDQRELGSYYWVQSAVTYDAAINKFFVVGDVHTVNAAKDTSVPYVYEYQMHVENYRPVIDSITSYQGDKPHNSEWLKVNVKEPA